LLAVIMIFSFTSCANARNTTLLTYEDMTYSAEEFSFLLSATKGYYAYAYSNYYSVDITTNEEIWTTKGSDNLTFAEALKNDTLNTAKIFLLTNYYCKELNLEVVDQTVIQKVDKLIEEITTAFNGKDLLAIELAQYGITIDQLREYYLNQERTGLLMDYWYGEGGPMAITESKVQEKFLADYKKFDVMIYNYTTTDEDGNKIPYYFNDITDSEARTYFDENYLKVQQIAFTKKDTNGNDLSDEEKAKAKDDAEAAFDEITAGTITFENKAVELEDNYDENIITEGDMTEAFMTSVTGMALDQIELIETEYAFYIVKKITTIDEDFNDIIDDIKEEMSNSRVKTIAEEKLAMVKSGDEKFEKDGDDAIYEFSADNLYKASDINSEELEKIINDTAVGEYSTYDDGTGYYIIKKTELTVEDIDSVYETIETELINNSYYEYIRTFFESVTINQEELDKFDAATAEFFEYYSY